MRPYRIVPDPENHADDRAALAGSHRIKDLGFALGEAESTEGSRSTALVWYTLGSGRCTISSVLAFPRRCSQGLKRSRVPISAFHMRAHSREDRPVLIRKTATCF